MCSQQLSVVRCHGHVTSCINPLVAAWCIRCFDGEKQSRHAGAVGDPMHTTLSPGSVLVVFDWSFRQLVSPTQSGGLCLSDTSFFTVGQGLFRGYLRAYVVVGLLSV